MDAPRASDDAGAQPDATTDVVAEVASAGRADGGLPDAPDGADAGDAHAPDAAVVACTDPVAERLATLLDDWPVMAVGTETRSFSSFDRTGGNSDGFDGTYSELYVNEAGEHVIFDSVGPGVLDTLWFTGPNEGGAGLDLGTVRFYLDDESTPRLALPWSDLFRGDRAPFLEPLVADNHHTTGAFASWVPVPYSRRLIVTTAIKPGFYQAHYETFPPDAIIASFDACTALASRAVFQQALDFRPNTDVSGVPLDTTFSGAGTLDTIQFRPSGTPTETDLQTARIRIAWDGETTPSVDVPLGSFFGSGLGAARIRSIPFSMDPNVYESRFRMPFWSGFHLSITGIAGTLSIHVGAARYDRTDTGYFHARASDAEPTVANQDFEWLGIPGAGKLAGTVLTVHPESPTTKRWWEGDTRSYANGRRTPGIDGTGHEDDHLGGWSTTLFENPFTLPLQGVPATEILDRNGQVNANATFYRLYPGVHFLDGIRHGTEHGSRNGVAGNYGGVAFYYLAAAPVGLVETDAVSPGDPASRKSHAYTATAESAPVALSSSFEGRDDTTSITATTVDHAGVAAFDVELGVPNAGCFLRRWYDQKNGRQRATVRVDGTEAGTWYAADFNTTHRWAERDYFVPTRYVAGKATAHIEIEPAANAPPWSVVDYRVLCVEAGK